MHLKWSKPLKLGIMQPYFLPYVGYFQLLAAVDQFILYDNIKYTKKGWINRNRMLFNGADTIFSLPLKKGSDSLYVVDRELAPSFDRTKMLNKFKEAYNRAPQYELTYPVVERIVQYEASNLFQYIHHSIYQLCKYLGINTEIKISSEAAIDHKLKRQERVLALCKAVGADTYINTIGGIELYTKNDFRNQGVNLQFIKAKPFEYAQFDNRFVPWLSIVDVLMFNPLSTVKAYVNNNYELN
jgi:hypothetical protein